MSYAPATLQELAAYWVGHGGVNLGIVGDPRHVAARQSYHLGRDKLDRGAYSRRTPRDVAGLSNAASAIDLGKLGGKYANLRAFSEWLVDQARTNAPGTSDMREIIYSPDGVKVLRWDRERGFASLPQPGEADDTHRFHTHISWYRDAESRDHRTAFLPYWTGEDDMGLAVTLRDPAVVGSLVIAAGVDAIRVSNGKHYRVPQVATRPAVTAQLSGGQSATGYLVDLDGDELHFIRASEPVTFTPNVPAGDCSGAIAADRAKARIVYT